MKLIQKVMATREEVLYMIFLDLHKAHDALKRSRCLEILKGYGMGPKDLFVLRRYIERLQMMAQAGGYYIENFCRERCVTQGEKLFSNIFNVVMEAVVRHWESLVDQGDGYNVSDNSSNVEADKPAR